MGKKAITFIWFFLACQCAGAFGAIFTRSAVPGWYAMINKPEFTPPSWVFGPVWFVLYSLMAASGAIVWQTMAGPARTAALTAFFIQLLLNALWTPIFFGAHRIGLALVDMALLWVAILVVIFLFYRLSRPAAVLLMPYFLWVSFAFLLNYSFLILNR